MILTEHSEQRDVVRPLQDCRMKAAFHDVQVGLSFLFFPFSHRPGPLMLKKSLAFLTQDLQVSVFHVVYTKRSHRASQNPWLWWWKQLSSVSSNDLYLTQRNRKTLWDRKCVPLNGISSFPGLFIFIGSWMQKLSQMPLSCLLRGKKLILEII